MTSTPAPFRITDAWQAQERPATTRGGRAEVQLLAPLEYHVGSADSGEIIVVPAGFVTDFASIPRGLWNLMPPMGRWGRAAIIHDFLYITRGRAFDAGWLLKDMMTVEQRDAYARLCSDRPTINARAYTRQQADDIFREAMAVVGVDPVTRNLMHRAVRAFGAGGWGH